MIDATERTDPRVLEITDPNDEGQKDTEEKFIGGELIIFVTDMPSGTERVHFAHDKPLEALHNHIRGKSTALRLVAIPFPMEVGDDDTNLDPLDLDITILRGFKSVTEDLTLPGLTHGEFFERFYTHWVTFPIQEVESYGDLTLHRPLTIDAQSCFQGIEFEELEDGMTSNLGERITALVKKHGDAAIKALSTTFGSGSIPPEEMSHTLRWIGRIKDTKTMDARLGLLADNLKSQSPIIRDGAALGLGIMGNPKAISDLREAVENETVNELKKDMQRVLGKLEKRS